MRTRNWDATLWSSTVPQKCNARLFNFLAATLRQLKTGETTFSNIFEPNTPQILFQQLTSIRNIKEKHTLVPNPACVSHIQHFSAQTSHATGYVATHSWRPLYWTVQRSLEPTIASSTCICNTESRQLTSRLANIPRQHTLMSTPPQPGSDALCPLHFQALELKLSAIKNIGVV